MRYAHTKAALLLCLMSATLHAQGTPAPAATTPAPAVITPPPVATLPAYDVTTIKPHKGDDNGVHETGRPGMYEGLNVSLKNFIATAYGVRAVLVYGLPAWAESARYDIEAKVSEPDRAVLKNLTSEQRHAMLAGILKDRFNIVVHTETKTISVYELAVTPDGPKFQASAPLSASIAGDPNKPQGSHWSGHTGEFTATRVPISQLSEQLGGIVDHVIVDKTGLTGIYDLHLLFTPEDQAGKLNDNGLPADAPPVIYQALREQLGLKLTPAKDPVTTIVVDKISEPEAN